MSRQAGFTEQDTDGLYREVREMEAEKEAGAVACGEPFILSGRQELLAEMMDHTMRYINHHYAGRGGQGRTLRVLDKHGPMTQQELQNRLEIRPSSVSELLAKLEAAGFVVRRRDEKDRRRWIIAITPEGKVDLEEHEARRIHRQSVLYAGLTDEEQNEMIRLLAKLWSDWDDGENEHWNEIRRRAMEKIEATNEPGSPASGEEEEQAEKEGEENPCI